MKNIFIIAAILFLFAPVSAQTKMTDREFDNLKGKVKSVVIEQSAVVKKKGREVEGSRTTTEEKYFDKSGNITKSSKNTYDSRIYTFIDGDKTYKSTVTSSSDIPPGIPTIQGNPDTSAQDSKIKEKPADTLYDYKYKYKYDAQGRIIEEKQYSNTGKEAGTEVYTYDAQGRLIKISNYNEGEISYIETYELDSKGVELKTVLDLGGAGNESDFMIGIYTDYQFDAQGNWIKRTETYTYKRRGEKAVDKTIHHRKITYYEN